MRDKIFKNKIDMKKIISILVAAIAAMTLCMAQNGKADNILGRYSSVQGGEGYKVEVTKNPDGSYKAKIFWISEPNDPKTGKRKYDVKNPDKALRNVPSDQIVLFDGLKYNAEKQVWTDAKIYDPQRGIRVSCTAKFDDAKTLTVRGSVFGIGETAIWKRID